MMRRIWMMAAVAGMMVCAMSAAAQLPETGYWRAASPEAKSTTGDVALGTDKIIIDLYPFTMAHVRALEAGELSSVFDVDSRSAAGTASLYRLEIPAERKFLHKTSICGSDDTTWMVTYAVGRRMQVAFFSGQKPPVFTMEAMESSGARCGVYGYVR